MSTPTPNTKMLGRGTDQSSTFTYKASYSRDRPPLFTTLPRLSTVEVDAVGRALDTLRAPPVMMDDELEDALKSVSIANDRCYDRSQHIEIFECSCSVLASLVAHCTGGSRWEVLYPTLRIIEHLLVVDKNACYLHAFLEADGFRAVVLSLRAILPCVSPKMHGFGLRVLCCLCPRTEQELVRQWRPSKEGPAIEVACMMEESSFLDYVAGLLAKMRNDVVGDCNVVHEAWWSSTLYELKHVLLLYQSSHDRCVQARDRRLRLTIDELETWDPM